MYWGVPSGVHFGEDEVYTLEVDTLARERHSHWGVH